jgi:cytoskeletal protein CcmA (bactofilin family)
MLRSIPPEWRVADEAGEADGRVRATAAAAAPVTPQQRKPVQSRPESTKEASAMSQKQPPVSEEEAPAVSVLSPKITVRNAEIETDEDLTIHGSYLDGKLRVRRLTIAQGATVTGEVRAAHVVCHGSLQASVTADAIYVMKGAALGGTIKCRTLGIQPGSVIKATIDADTTEQVEHGIPSAGPAYAMATKFDEFPQLRVVHRN